MTDIRFELSSGSNLQSYLDLYQRCFPPTPKYFLSYLDWLYVQNPAGQAFGIDALDGEQLIGQVIAVPGSFVLNGELRKGLVAVNVSVRPEYQGRFLFKKLGLRLCDEAATIGADLILGIANNAATPGWVRQMGFQLVAPLETFIGLGGLGLGSRWPEILQNSALHRVWTACELEWRMANPFNQLRAHYGNGTISLIVLGASKQPGIRITAEIPTPVDFSMASETSKGSRLFPRLFLGLIPGIHSRSLSVTVPSTLKPSPLNLVFKDLRDPSRSLDSRNCLINFLDFDIL